MTRAAVEQALYLMDRAFAPSAGEPEHALLTNLESVRDGDWLRLPPAGQRPIAQIAAQHVGDCKFMYANHGFEDGRMNWNDFSDRWKSPPPKSEMIGWLREAHAYFRRVVEKLDDGDLTVKRKAPWGKMYETRWLIANMIEHDLYHAGEINHIRSLLEDTDAWPNYDD